MDKNIICFGCGELGEYFVDLYGKYLQIDFFLDNQLGGVFCGYKRFLPSRERCEGKFVIVTNMRYYLQIAEQLRSYGLQENVDFISIREFEKISVVRTDLRTVKCWFVDFWDGFDPYDNFLLRALKKFYNIILDPEKPDYLFSSIFFSKKGATALHYSCVRIFYTGENLIPDFNVYDYAIGFDYIDYGDRYLRWPLYRLYQKDFELAKRKHVLYDIDQFMNRDFCCRVVSSGVSEFREQVFTEMNHTRYIASGGKCKNNMPNKKCVEDKAVFLSRYKFNLAMENADSSGYVTEKIVQAWAAGCIPIYWGGGGKIGEEFNKEAFIDCGDFSTTAELLDYLKELEHDRDALQNILKAPIFLNWQDRGAIKLEMFLKNIIDKAEEKKMRRLSLASIYARNQEQMYLQYRH